MGPPDLRNRINTSTRSVISWGSCTPGGIGCLFRRTCRELGIPIDLLLIAAAEHPRDHQLRKNAYRPQRKQLFLTHATCGAKSFAVSLWPNQKNMKPGSYCIPSNKQEWSAVLDLAISLGLSNAPVRLYEDYPSVWLATDDNVVPCVRVPHSGYGPTYVKVKDFIAGMYQLAEERKKPKCCEWLQNNMRPFYPFFGGPITTPPCKSSGDAKDLASKWTGYTTCGTFKEPCYYTQDQLRDIQIPALKKRVKELEAQVWENGCKISCAKRDANALDGRLSVRLEKLEKVVSEEMGRRYWDRQTYSYLDFPMYMNYRRPYLPPFNLFTH